ncbi:MAG TPA: hypothetical protein VFG32_08610 [Bacteroidota bacterium]|nr:hypothetical protein [Bacteroidota bacterium]
MARLATGCHGSKTNFITVAAQEIGSFVVCRKKRHKIRVAILTSVGCFHIVVACVACGHIRKVLSARKLNLIQTLMACHALHTSGCMALVGEDYGAAGCGTGDNVVRSRMAETAVIGNLIFMTGGTLIMRAREVIG